MSELLATERAYVSDLDLCVEVYVAAFRGAADAPNGLRGKEKMLFGNLEEIALFHKDVFLGELEKYSRNPEDVGHCFVRWAHKFDMYVEYCRNKPESNTLLVQEGSGFFEAVQRSYGLEHPLPAFLIKPVQRITKYALLLKDLQATADDGRGEIHVSDFLIMRMRHFFLCFFAAWAIFLDIFLS